MEDNFTYCMRMLGVDKKYWEPTPLNARWFLRNEAIKHRGKALYLDALDAAREVLENE